MTVNGSSDYILSGLLEFGPLNYILSGLLDLGGWPIKVLVALESRAVDDEILTNLAVKK